MEKLQTKKQEIEELINDPDFWNNQEKAQMTLKSNKEIEDILGTYNGAFSSYEDLEVLFDMANEDETMEKELENEINNIWHQVEELKIETMLDEEYDKNNAILSIHAGTGGLDAQDWAKMLLRMYSRFSSNMDYKINELDYNQDPEAGIKSVTLRISGKNAYGFLKSEKGVHRLVRISPFDSSGKRHTSFASVDVMPELTDDIKIDINPQDLRIDTFRSGGAGGQSVNKTESAVRITHIPTGVVVQCQNERSQLINKDVAMKMLMAKLIEIKNKLQKEKIEDIQGEYSQIAWGSQIRSYVFQPYTLIKDHRTNKESGNINAVMDGDIMDFILAYLQNLKNKGE